MTRHFFHDRGVEGRHLGSLISATTGRDFYRTSNGSLPGKSKGLPLKSIATHPVRVD
jgi:hypothetical protein